MSTLEILLLIIGILIIIGIVIVIIVKIEVAEFIRRMDDHENYTGFDNFKNMYDNED